MASTKRRTEWVRYDMRDGSLFCERCGDRYRVNLPCLVDVLAATSKAYQKVHRRCRTRPEAAK